MALAIATGIPPSVWAAEDTRTVYTALHLLEKQAEQIGGNRG